MASEGVYIDAEQVKRLLSDPGGPMARDLAKRGIRVETRAKQLCPVDTGRLRSSITWGLHHDEKGLRLDVGSNVFYAPCIEYGTGIYGPHRSPIVPTSKPFLAWKSKDGQWHRARSVRGRPATPFLRPALAAAG